MKKGIADRIAYSEIHKAINLLDELKRIIIV